MSSPSSSKGLMVIISGPSGVGKTTITHHVELALDGAFSVSMTTRPMSPGDVEGRDYYFVDRARFEQCRDEGELLEWAEVFGHLYGTPRRPVTASLAKGQLVLCEIDVEGAVQIKQNMPQAFAIFVDPPSEQALLHRLRERGRDPEEVIKKRFAKAKLEIERSRACGVYDGFILNDRLEDAVTEGIELVRAQLNGRQSDVAPQGNR